MYTVYCFCLTIGLITLLVSLILDGISDLLQGLSFFDIHFDFLPGILPLSPLQLCAFLTGFGGMGMTLYTLNSYHLVFALLIGFILSYLTYFSLNKLKQVNSDALTEQDLLGMEGTVIVSVFENSFGSVSFNTKIGKITYTAQSDHTILQGQIVKVIHIDGTIITVTDDPTYFFKTYPK